MKTEDNIPNHVVVIPDGNRRWAKKRGMEPWEGHEAGAKNMEGIIDRAFKLGVKQLSFWGSSLDNLKKRPFSESKALLRIYEKYFKKLIESEEVHKNEARINVIGRWEDQFPKKVKDVIKECIEKTKDYKKYALNFFLAYSGDDEMLETVQKIAKKYDSAVNITKNTIKENLLTKDLPVVDLMIPTGGDPHLSAGFMMWDTANVQLFFSEKLYPDFKENEFEAAIRDYQKRERRLGK